MAAAVNFSSPQARAAHRNSEDKILTVLTQVISALSQKALVHPANDSIAQSQLELQSWKEQMEDMRRRKGAFQLQGAISGTFRKLFTCLDLELIKSVMNQLDIPQNDLVDALAIATFFPPNQPLFQAVLDKINRNNLTEYQRMSLGMATGAAAHMGLFGYVQAIFQKFPGNVIPGIHKSHALLSAIQQNGDTNMVQLILNNTSLDELSWWRLTMLNDTAIDHERPECEALITARIHQKGQWAISRPLKIAINVGSKLALVGVLVAAQWYFTRPQDGGPSITEPDPTFVP
jgi:hypothetical protein